MSSVRLAFRTLRPSIDFKAPICVTARRMASGGNVHNNHNADDHQRIQSRNPLNGIPKGPPEKGAGDEMGVGEIEGIEFKIEPLRRTGEDSNTTRARLLYQSRKRGTLESDLLMSTFADAHLKDMTPAQMAQYDLFLDENDWDIYYWATQEPSPKPQEAAEGADSGAEGVAFNAKALEEARPFAQRAEPVVQSRPQLETTDAWRQGKPRSGEWAQTVGTFKPAYRPVPARWKNSEILAMLRRHVISRSAGGIHEGQMDVSGESRSQGAKGSIGRGMAFMPPVFQTDRL